MKWIKTGAFVLYSCLTIYIVNCVPDNSRLFVYLFSLPLCAWVTVLLHELSHYFCFKLLEFDIKELRVGLFIVNFEGDYKKIKVDDVGFFYGFCTIENNHRERKFRLLLSLLAGGLSGLMVSIVSSVLIISNVVPNKWVGVFMSFICVGVYSFYATLLSPRSADRRLIEKIMKE